MFISMRMGRLQKTFWGKILKLRRSPNILFMHFVDSVFIPTPTYGTVLWDAWWHPVSTLKALN